MSGKHSKDESNKKYKQIKSYKEYDNTRMYTRVDTAGGQKVNDETKVYDLKKNKNKKNKGKKPKKKWQKVLKAILLTILLVIIVAVISAVAVVTAIFKTDKWSITKEDLLSDAGATIYNEDGTEEILTLTGDEINKKINLEDMGKIPDAFISIEDERFYEHKGVDVKRTTAAIFNYILHKGDSSFGGSTITQQLVKISMNDKDKSWERKVREWSRATQVEKMLTKDQILQRYLNRIYLGSSNGLEIRGVEAAANYYFNKSAKDLSIAEASFIAGINHSPNSYNVFTSETDISEKVKTRTLNVIGKMHELGKINDDEYNSAVEETKNGLNFTKGNVSNGKSSLSYHAAAAINQISNELADKKDISYDEAREIVVNSGYKIYTTVNTDVQKKMEEVFSNSKYIYKGIRAKKGVDNSGQSGMVVIDPKTGYVVGEVGGLGSDNNTLGLNRGLTKRQGGSAFKPLVTVAPGLENKVITASTLFYDVQTTFPGNYVVHNDSNSYHNIENMRSILTHSCNVPEVKLLSILGTKKSAEFLKKINIEVDEKNVGLSMALGTVDVSPLQMAAGYAMIANGGTYITPTFYTKVLDKDGNVVIESSQEKVDVMSKQNAYIEESLLTGPVKSGTASHFASFLGNMDVAGKTGTTQTAGDRWFCGMTPYYAAACWYGNDNNNGEFRSSNCAGQNPACTVWFNCMKSIHKDLAVKIFEKPDGIISVKICKASGKKATGSCTDTYTEIFNKDSVPGDCDGHETVKICKETNKVATEFCPDTEDRAFSTIDTEKNANWTPNLKGNAKPTETCDIHTTAPEIDVPDIKNKTQKEATDTLTKAGFKVKVNTDEDYSKIKGIVTKQSATKAAKDSEITIWVNSADGGVNVPNVVGKTKKAATETLTKAGFKVKTEPTNSTDSYVVTKQSTTSKAIKGAEITITLKAPETENKNENTTNTTKESTTSNTN